MDNHVFWFDVESLDFWAIKTIWIFVDVVLAQHHLLDLFYTSLPMTMGSCDDIELADQCSCNQIDHLKQTSFLQGPKIMKLISFGQD